MQLTLEQYYMGRDKEYTPDSVVRANAEYTVSKVNRLFEYLAGYGVQVEQNPRTLSAITSGWRPAEVNMKTQDAAPRSKHITGCACDIYDPDGVIDDFLMENTWLLKELGLFMEHPSATKGWCHVQTVPPKSGKLIFYP